MNKKPIIQILIIVCAFGGSALVLYNGLFKGNSYPSPALDPAGNMGSQTNVEKILPYGETMDFKGVLEKQNLQFGILEYPKLDPGKEVGISEQQLITPPPTLTPSSPKPKP